MSALRKTPMTPTTGADLPPYVDKHGGVAVVKTHYRPISVRTFEQWPIKYRVIDGRRIWATADIIDFIDTKLATARIGWGTRSK